MSAQPFAHDPHSYDAASVHEALPVEYAEEFRTAWNAALDEARRDLDLGKLTARLQSITAEYRAVAAALASSRASQARQDGQRWAKGQEIDCIPASEVLSGLG
jgi:hypothetical protein